MADLTALMTSKSAEWRTPRALFETLHAQHCFTLDAAASHENAMLPTYYTIDDDALGETWAPHRVWLNPPYGKEMAQWMAKAATSRTPVVVLVPARTDTAWWHDWVMRRATQVAYVRGRLVFDGARSGAPFPSAIIIYEPGVKRRRPVAIDKEGRRL